MDAQQAAYPRAKKEAPAKRFSILNVAIAVASLALLAAVLFPVYGGQKGPAKKSQCLSNMKQSVLAAILYSSDNDDQVPFGRGRVSVATATPLPIYEDLFAPYIKNAHTNQCPHDVESKGSPVEGKSWFEAYGSSYTYRPILAQLEHFGGAVGAEKTVFIHEASNFHKSSNGIPSRNAAFYDGHAK
ncbi:MAG TPA: hypothetical protein VK171_04230, partial [Fimbriimonas sp.]|nr:hypothetical protein [Fimbriimonas sp.]